MHILDLAPLYPLILNGYLNKSPIPSGKKGIYFAETGEHTWLEISQGIAKAALQQGLIKDETVTSLGLAEGSAAIGLNESQLELSMSSK